MGTTRPSILDRTKVLMPLGRALVLLTKPIRRFVVGRSAWLVWFMFPLLCVLDIVSVCGFVSVKFEWFD